MTADEVGAQVDPHGGGAAAVEAACVTSGNNHDSASEYPAAVDDEAAGLAVQLQEAIQVGDGRRSAGTIYLATGKKLKSA